MAVRDEVFEIEDIAVLETLNNPTRLRILSHLDEPASVRSVAEAMGVPVTRLYYHVNLLEDIGVIEVVETRKVGAMIERLYQCVATTFRPGAEIFAKGTDFARLAGVSAGTVLDGARLDAEAGLIHHFEAMAAGSDRSEEYPGTISRSVLRLSRETAAALSDRLEELVYDLRREADETDSDTATIEYGLSIVFFPLVSPMRGTAEP